MILDSSALVAILRNEPAAVRLSHAAGVANRCAVSTATYLETSIVVTGAMHEQLDILLDEISCEIVPVDLEQARLARRAYQRFGKGSGSRARLNFGDCFSYALASSRSEPLLFLGEDFRHTDITPAIAD